MLILTTSYSSIYSIPTSGIDKKTGKVIHFNYLDYVLDYYNRFEHSLYFVAQIEDISQTPKNLIKRTAKSMLRFLDDLLSKRIVLRKDSPAYPAYYNIIGPHAASDQMSKVRSIFNRLDKMYEERIAFEKRIERNLTELSNIALKIPIYFDDGSAALIESLLFLFELFCFVSGTLYKASDQITLTDKSITTYDFDASDSMVNTAYFELIQDKFHSICENTVTHNFNLRYKAMCPYEGYLLHLTLFCNDYHRACIAKYVFETPLVRFPLRNSMRSPKDELGIDLLFELFEEQLPYIESTDHLLANFKEFIFNLATKRPATTIVVNIVNYHRCMQRLIDKIYPKLGSITILNLFELVFPNGVLDYPINVMPSLRGDMPEIYHTLFIDSSYYILHKSGDLIQDNYERFEINKKTKEIKTSNRSISPEMVKERIKEITSKGLYY